MPGRYNHAVITSYSIHYTKLYEVTAKSTFEDDDHRKFNRHGEEFDRGETFSGVDYETGLTAVEELRKLVPDGWTMAQFALRWITRNNFV